MLALTGFGLLLAFSLAQPQSGNFVVLMLGLLLVVTLTALLDWHKSPAGTLQWDGVQWHWSCHTDPASCLLTLRMDWQRVMLVSLSANGIPTLWLWLESADDALRWKALRRAIVSSQSDSAMEHDTALSADHPGAVA